MGVREEYRTRHRPEVEAYDLRPEARLALGGWEVVGLGSFSGIEIKAKVAGEEAEYATFADDEHVRT